MICRLSLKIFLEMNFCQIMDWLVILFNDNSDIVKFEKKKNIYNF